MDKIYFIVIPASFIASLLTLYSGFGLGTLLMPVFAVFFPVPVAISLTAVVHLAHNLFKLFWFGKYADKEIYIKFGLAAIAAAFIGAWCLNLFTFPPPIFTYTVGNRTAQITPLNLVIASLMIFFSFVETLPAFKNFSFPKKYLVAGGLLSGFFGGLSGYQGALRSAFLIRYNLSKEVFLGTGVAIACMVDIMRLFVYSSRFQEAGPGHLPLLTAAAAAALAGVWLGNGFLKKTTVRGIQIWVSVMLFLIAIALALGLI